MAIKTSSKATDSTVKDFKYWTGVIPYTVLAVNPNLAELKTLGVDYMQQEPEYYTEQEFDGKKFKNSIVDFWVKSAPVEEFPDLDIVTNVRFRIAHEPWVGQSGKKQFINAYGRTAWAMDIPALDANKYYKNEGSRACHKGEEDLHKFLFAWLNMIYDTTKKQYDPCLVNVKKIVDGDFSELKAIVMGSKEYTVKIPTGVNVVEKEGKVRYYQVLYNQMFLKHNQTSTNRLEEYMAKDEYTEFKVYNGDLYFTSDIREFNKSVTPDVDEPTPEAATSNIF